MVPSLSWWITLWLVDKEILESTTLVSWVYFNQNCIFTFYMHKYKYRQKNKQLLIRGFRLTFLYIVQKLIMFNTSDFFWKISPSNLLKSFPQYSNCCLVTTSTFPLIKHGNALLNNTMIFIINAFYNTFRNEKTSAKHFPTGADIFSKVMIKGKRNWMILKIVWNQLPNRLDWKIKGPCLILLQLLN